MPISPLPEYQVEIRNAMDNVFVVADLPEQFNLALASSFESRDSAINAGDILGEAGHVINASSGVGAQFQLLSHAVWRGTSPIEFGLQLIFDAETNSREDVHAILVKLGTLTLPKNEGNGILTPPIPAGVWNKDRFVTSVRVGRQWYFPSVAVTSVGLTSESRLNAGYPIAGGVDIQFRTIVTYGKDDLRKAGSMSGYGGSSGGAGYLGVAGLPHNPGAK